MTNSGFLFLSLSSLCSEADKKQTEVRFSQKSEKSATEIGSVLGGIPLAKVVAVVTEAASPGAFRRETRNNKNTVFDLKL